MHTKFSLENMKEGPKRRAEDIVRVLEVAGWKSVDWFLFISIALLRTSS